MRRTMGALPVSVQHLSFSYDKTPILDDITLSCSRGTFTTILGPNGSGKTTLLRILSGWLKTVPGSVFINGKDIRGIKEKDLAKLIACLRQDHTGGFDFSVQELVLLGRSPYIPYLSGPKETDRQAVDAALNETGIISLKNRQMSTLSGGELQRVYVAQALAQNADILLLDEPVTHLDVKYQLEILSLIKKLQQENTMTVLAVLHDLNLASLFSDKIILLKKGRVFAGGTPDRTLTRENIHMVFDVTVQTQPHPDNGAPQIFITPGKDGIHQ